MSRKIKRSEIIAKIKALLAMTVEKGCTPDEAIAAAGRVAALMDRHRIDMSEVHATPDEPEEPIVDKTFRFRDDVGERLWKPALGVSALTNTKFYRAGVSNSEHVFVGRETDVLVASYLLSVCETALRRQAELHDFDNRFCRKPVRDRRRATFLDGMSLSLMRRLLDMHEERRVKGQGIVPVDDQLEAEIKRRGLTERWLQPGRVRKVESDSLEEGRLRGEATFIGDAVEAAKPETRRFLT